MYFIKHTNSVFVWRELSHTVVRDTRYLLYFPGLSWEEAVSTCPANVVPACHNAQDSVTISGKKEDIADFVRVLKAKGVFAREVDSDGVAFHSFMMDGIKDRFRQRLDKVLFQPSLFLSFFRKSSSRIVSAGCIDSSHCYHCNICFIQ